MYFTPNIRRRSCRLAAIVVESFVVHALPPPSYAIAFSPSLRHRSVNVVVAPPSRCRHHRAAIAVLSSPLHSGLRRVAVAISSMLSSRRRHRCAANIRLPSRHCCCRLVTFVVAAAIPLRSRIRHAANTLAVFLPLPCRRYRPVAFSYSSRRLVDVVVAPSSSSRSCRDCRLVDVVAPPSQCRHRRASIAVPSPLHSGHCRVAILSTLSLRRSHRLAANTVNRLFAVVVSPLPFRRSCVLVFVASSLPSRQRCRRAAVTFSSSSPSPRAAAVTV